VFSVLRGYEGWETVAISRSENLVAAMLANLVMIDAYRAATATIHQLLVAIFVGLLCWAYIGTNPNSHVDENLLLTSKINLITRLVWVPCGSAGRNGPVGDDPL
jgi:hypothetical protein